ncbi:hypothetical protein [Mesorhizobium sp. YM1C-6-2]|uniref:hypothetical protein n=1 Tax=Mesorhizobium sp. YM1C-6-2 TaxID=1827501 RepID=UPI000EF1DD5D|nr:hypothetical protein [Mesorhizobium sp. YM1C-6-2]RLP22152.1 hypothetical protein D8676_25855 [Mesorhizobium sp. YM1C-6-2]
MSRTALASVWPPTRAVAMKAEHAPMSPMQAIRRKCQDCSGQQLVEVKRCETVTCPLWPFRAGRHPYTRKGLLEADPERRACSSTPKPLDRSPSRIGLLEASGGKDGGNEPVVTFIASTTEVI